MKSQLANFLIYLLLTGALVACEAPAVEVSFAEPYPAGGRDATAFLPRDQGQYVQLADTATTLLVGPQQVVQRRFWELTLRERQLDSLGLSAQAHAGRGRDGRYYTLHQLQPGSVRLRWAELDTLASLTGPHASKLRRYRGVYYLNSPIDTPVQWKVTRLLTEKGYLHWQYFNPDSLRVRALAAGTVQQTRAGGTLHLSLRPARGHATRQVNRYAGLWLTLNGYRRRASGAGS